MTLDRRTARSPVVSRTPPPASGDPAAGRRPPPSDGQRHGRHRPPRLARRKPGAKLPKDLAGEPPPVHTGTDEVLLKRIRTALRALR